MRFVSFLLVLCLPWIAFADHRFVTIHLKAGKQIDGEWISGDASSVQVKDGSGVVISVKKAAIASVEPAETSPLDGDGKPTVFRAKEQSLAEFAAQVKQSRTGKSRVFTMTDLSTAPEISVMNSTEASRSLPMPATVRAEKSVDVGPWQKKIESARREIEGLQPKQTLAASRCEEAKSQHFVKPKKHQGVLVWDPAATPEECERLIVIESQLHDAESRLDDLQTQARRLGIPWSALE